MRERLFTYFVLFYFVLDCLLSIFIFYCIDNNLVKESSFLINVLTSLYPYYIALIILKIICILLVYRLYDVDKRLFKYATYTGIAFGLIAVISNIWIIVQVFYYV